jgi:hypothetical protein
MVCSLDRKICRIRLSRKDPAESGIKMKVFRRRRISVQVSAPPLA